MTEILSDKVLISSLFKFQTSTTFRSSHRRCSVRIDVLRNFAKFFFNKVTGLAALAHSGIYVYLGLTVNSEQQQHKQTKILVYRVNELLNINAINKLYLEEDTHKTQMIFFHSIIKQVNCDAINYSMSVPKTCWISFQIKDVLGRTDGKCGMYNFHKDNWTLIKNLGVGVKTFKTKNDISMKLFSKKYVSVVSIVCMFLCLVLCHVIWIRWHFYNHPLRIM